MSSGLRKFLVTMMVVAFATVILITVFRGRPTPKVAPVAPPTPAPASTSAATTAPTSDQTGAPPAPSAGAPAANAAATTTAPAAIAGTLTARPVDASTAVTATRPAAPIGSLDPDRARFSVTFAPNAAGISSIVFSDLWKDARASAQARRHRADPSEPLPPDSDRYVLAGSIKVFEDDRTYDVPMLAMRFIEVNGVMASLFGSVWSETAPGSFSTELVDGTGAPVVRLERTFTLGPSFDLMVKQSVVNLTASPVNVRWMQYGPSELAFDPTAYIDARRMQFGYLLPPDRDPTQSNVIASGQLFERSTIASLISKNSPDLWPNTDAREGLFTLSWFASKNRYFCLAVHAPWTETNPTRSLADVVSAVRIRGNGAADRDLAILSELHGPVRQIPASGQLSFDMGVFAGPLDRQLLRTQEPFASLGLDQAVVYMLSSCCSFCTFGWLANFMSWFLTLLHNYLVFDWGLAIIVLVIVVRLALHPLMKRSQIQMQRFGRQMAELKPELDALQKRYAGDAQKIQQEQMRLYREKGINPAGCVSGILPTFLQMPIWIALYAVLFFAWDLRQAPAFFGVFQLFNGWAFLGDLSRADNFILLPNAIDLWLFKLTSINLLPLLMGVVFFLQQKYMTPPTPNMTPEQEQQQKIMKIMMVVMFPVMLYVAPSGLTLYILTSTCIGIWESRMVKKHIDRYGIAAPASAGPKKQDRLGKIYEGMLERARKKQSEQKRTFKERG